MVSLDFAEIEDLQMRGDWKKATEIMIKSAREIESAGADFALICTNTMHLMADEVQAAINIPLLHIADATAEAVKEAGLGVVGLLGTRFTMEEEFYRGRLETRHQLGVLIPGLDGRNLVHTVIYDELVQGEIRNSSREKYLEVIEDLVAEGAEGIVLGCTEIGLLVKAGDVSVPIFDTMEIHALAAVRKALSEEG